mgnify:CR=1 FL=1
MSWRRRALSANRVAAQAQLLLDEMRKFNYVGDTQWISGEIVAVRDHLVDVKVTMRNQRDEETVRGDATLAFGDKPYPEVPADLPALQTDDALER